MQIIASHESNEVVRRSKFSILYGPGLIFYQWCRFSRLDIKDLVICKVRIAILFDVVRREEYLLSIGSDPELLVTSGMSSLDTKLSFSPVA
jgi:hypothetical protein